MKNNRNHEGEANLSQSLNATIQKYLISEIVPDSDDGAFLTLHEIMYDFQWYRDKILCSQEILNFKKMARAIFVMTSMLFSVRCKYKAGFILPREVVMGVKFKNPMSQARVLTNRKREGLDMVGKVKNSKDVLKQDELAHVLGYKGQYEHNIVTVSEVLNRFAICFLSPAFGQCVSVESVCYALVHNILEMRNEVEHEPCFRKFLLLYEEITMGEMLEYVTVSLLRGGYKLCRISTSYYTMLVIQDYLLSGL